MPPINETAIASLLRHIEPQYRNMCGMILRGESATFSQAWQDWYLFHNIFGHIDRLSTWGGGVYVDVGTNAATEISNTLFFDKCLGWRGVCFEPQRHYHKAILQNRSCQLVPRCVVGLGASTHGHMKGRTGSATLVRDGTKGGECVHANTVLPNRLGAGTRIDLLSIDIEGLEAEVLRCFPWSIGAHAILIETDKAGEMREVDRFFHRHGYVNYESFAGGYLPQGLGFASWLDNLYVRRPRETVYPPWRYNKMEPLPKGRLKLSHGQRYVIPSNCSEEDVAARRLWCTPWHSWEPLSANWGPCELDQGGLHQDTLELDAPKEKLGEKVASWTSSIGSPLARLEALGNKLGW